MPTAVVLWSLFGWDGVLPPSQGAMLLLLGGWLGVGGVYGACEDLSLPLEKLSTLGFPPVLDTWSGRLGSASGSFAHV